MADRFVTDLTDQDAINRVSAEFFGDAKPAHLTKRERHCGDVGHLARLVRVAEGGTVRVSDSAVSWPMTPPLPRLLPVWRKVSQLLRHNYDDKSGASA